jgi:hypothetical protein
VPRSRAHRAYAAKDKDSKSPADMATEVVYRTSTGQACEQQPGSVWVQQDAEEEQPPPPKRAKRAPSQRQAAAAAAAAAGAPSAFSGVLQPFQAVKVCACACVHGTVRDRDSAAVWCGRVGVRCPPQPKAVFAVL